MEGNPIRLERAEHSLKWEIIRPFHLNHLKRCVQCAPSASTPPVAPSTDSCESDGQTGRALYRVSAPEEGGAT